MSPLENFHKHLIFDFCMGITSDEQAIQAKELISSNPQAAQLYEKFKESFYPLDCCFEHASCPDELVEKTLFRLKNLPGTGHVELQQLLAAELIRKPPVVRRSWRNMAEITAIAAVILFVSGVITAPLNYMRQNSWKTVCENQLKKIAQGLDNYRAANNGELPAVASAAGQPWWKVGDQGTENQSNTRNVWLLAKQGYVCPTTFVCPGKREGMALQFDSTQAKNYNDFPQRKYVTYSFRIKGVNCPKMMPSREVIMADLNPLFESLPEPMKNSELDVKLNDRLAALNSSNHNGSGQNVLFCDGSVSFKKTRRTEITDDDIYTLQNTRVYKGVERPSSDKDAFLAP